MSMDVLQNKIRKVKNPSVVDLALKMSDLPVSFQTGEESRAVAYGRFCRELLTALKGIVPAVRVGFTAFAALGPDGLYELQSVLKAAASDGYYVLLEAPYVLSPMMAEATARSGASSMYSTTQASPPSSGMPSTHTSPRISSPNSSVFPPVQSSPHC